MTNKDNKQRLPHYLQNTKGCVKIQKENKHEYTGNEDSKKLKHKELSQMSKLEMERLLHMKGITWLDIEILNLKESQGILEVKIQKLEELLSIREKETKSI